MREQIGCPICTRQMTENSYADEHHLIPKSQGGKYSEKIKLHRICHDKIHSIWTESQLAGYYNTVERIINHQEMQTFIKWVKKRPPEFYVKTKRQKR
jgi:hypothetical protein